MAAVLVVAMASTTVLPSTISAARSALSWPIEPELTKPLYYLPLEHLGRARLANSDELAPPFDELGRDPETAISALGGSDHARVAVALLLLGGGGTDECHALVTPLCWPDGTTFGGPPKLGSDAQGEATYAHALVHRREAWHPGEYGTGWHNAAFWYGSLSTHAVGAEIQERVRQLAFKAAGDTEAHLAWCEKNIWKQWAPKVLNGALNDALLDARDVPPGARSKTKQAFATFASELALIELEVLVDHCLARTTVRGARRPAVIMKK